MTGNDANTGNPPPTLARIVTVIWLRGFAQNSDLTKDLLRLGALNCEPSSQGLIALFASPALALKASIDVVSRNTESVSAGISTAEVLNDISYLRLVEEAQTLSTVAEAGQILVSLSFQELVRTAVEDTTIFLDLGTRRLPAAGGQVRAFVVSDQRLPETYNVSSAKRPYLAHRFLGRRKEIDHLSEMIETCRLISIVGSSGIGKTALAARFELEIQERFQGGSFWVDLTSVSRPFLLLHQVAKSFELQSYDDSTALGRITRFISDHEVLLILDSTTGLEEPVARFCDHLLRECPNLVILTTGLRRLDLRGEEAYPITGLELPLPYESLEAIRTYDSVQVFLKEAATADPAFRLTPSNLDDVVGVATILEGSPEALTMAAKRLSVLSIRQLHARLRDDPLSELRLPPTSGPARGAEIALAMNLSVVSPWAKSLFEGLSTFSGPFDFEGVEAVCSNTDLPEAAILPALKELCEVHLVRRWPRSDKNRAFFLPLLAREFSQKLSLTAGKSKELASRKRRYRERRLAKIVDGLLAGKSEALDELDLLYEDVRERWRELLAGKGNGEVANVVVQLAGYWFQRGYYSEGQEVIREVLRSKGIEESKDFIRIVVAGAWIAIRRGDFDLAEEYCRMSVRQAHRLGSMSELAKGLNAAGCLALELNRPRTSRRMIRYAVELSASILDEKTRRIVTQNYAVALLEVRDLEGANRIFESLRSQAPAQQWSDLTLLVNAADLRLQFGDLRGCLDLLVQAARLIDSLPDPNILGLLYSTAAWAALQAGRKSDAATLIDAYVTILDHFALTLSPRRQAKLDLISHRIGSKPNESLDWAADSPTALLLKVTFNMY